MSSSTEVLRAKARIAWNSLNNIEGIMAFHIAFATAVLSTLLSGGTYLFWRVFRFLMEQEVFGPPLMDRLVGIVFLVFFCMLIFSNLIITLSTSYISREVDFLMAQPIPFTTTFRQKLLESTLYSSWAFVLLSLPFFLAFGISRDVPWTFYPLTALLLVPYLFIPAAIGAIVTMVVTAFLPARRTRVLVIALGVLSILLAIGVARVMNIRRLFIEAEAGNFTQIMSFLEIGSSPMIPSSWMMNGILSIDGTMLGPMDWRGYLYWLAMLAATALFLLQVSEWLAPKLYYRGWCLTRDSANRADVARHGFSPMILADRLFAFLPQPYRTLFAKDFRTFWRDPAQWTQLVILFGLMVLYIANLRSAQRYSATVEFLLSNWKTILALFNLGASCFILSILTTRFIYPMLSLEGRQFWSIGLAPMPRTAVVWQKFVLCASTTIVLAVILLAFSNWVLRVEPWLQTLTIVCAVVMAIALSSLSVGIGALMPNFREDNPARIASGVGGTANALLSMFYIGGTLMLVGVPVHLYSTGRLETSNLWQNHAVAWVALIVVVQVVFLVLPMALGLRKWNRLEF